MARGSAAVSRVRAWTPRSRSGTMTRMIDPVDLRAFLRIAECGSVSGAARALRLPKSSLSRSLSRLERELGSILVERSTRHLRLSDAGRLLQPHATRILEEVDAARDALGSVAGVVRGTLRINLAYAAAQALVAPMLPAFLARHPELRVALDVDSRRIDLLADDADLVIRPGGSRRLGPRRAQADGRRALPLRRPPLPRRTRHAHHGRRSRGPRADRPARSRHTLDVHPPRRPRRGPELRAAGHRDGAGDGDHLAEGRLRDRARAGFRRAAGPGGRRPRPPAAGSGVRSCRRSRALSPAPHRLGEGARLRRRARRASRNTCVGAGLISRARSFPRRCERAGCPWAARRPCRPVRAGHRRPGQERADTCPPLHRKASLQGARRRRMTAARRLVTPAGLWEEPHRCRRWRGR